MSFAFNSDETVIMRFPPISSITIPAKVIGIYGESGEDYASIDAIDKLNSVSFESDSQLRYIEKYAFYMCKRIQTIDLSPCKYLEIICDYGFNYCSGITSITLPKSVLTRIESYVFEYLSISSILIPASVEYIGHWTFFNCNNLESVIFDADSNLYEIGLYAFPSTPKFTNITFPKSYGKYTDSFELCSYILNVFVEEGNPTYHSLDGVIYTVDNASLIYFPRGRTDEYKILDGVRVIGTSAFIFTSLTHVVFPDSLKTIKSWSFACGKLKTLVIPQSCTNLEEFCFSGCYLLDNITIPDSVTSIGTGAFKSCTKLTDVRLPSNLSNIGGGVFQGCSNINITFDETANLKSNDQQLITDKSEKVISMYFGDDSEVVVASSVEKIKGYAFASVSCIKSVNFVGTSALNTIETYAFKSSGLESIVLPNSLRYISTYAFYQCKYLRYVKFGSQLDYIHQYAFSLCSALETVDFEDSCSYKLYKYAFQDDENLTTVNFGEGITFIGEYCFSNTTKLTTINFPSALTTIETYAFYNSGISSIDMEKSSVTGIPSFCFSKCSNLASIKLSNSIQTLGSNCFSYTEISNIELSESVRTIGIMCFRNCIKLETLKIPKESSLDTIEYGAFSGCFYFSSIILESDNFSLFNSALFDKNETKLIVMPPNSPIKFFSFPETLIEIGQSSLLGCKNLHQVFLPSYSVVRIKEHAFENCTNLRFINIPQSVQFVGDHAFYGCKKLQCGILIENTSSSFRGDLVSKAMLPDKCIKSCDSLYTLKTCRSSSSWKNYCFLIIMSR